MKTKKRGFTIVELIIVIAVIAILAAVLIPTFANVSKSAKESRALQEAKSGWDNYLGSTVNGNLPNRTSYIRYRNYGLDLVFEVQGASFIGRSPLKAELVPVFDYEYDVGTQNMLCLRKLDTSNTTEEMPLNNG